MPKRVKINCQNGMSKRPSRQRLLKALKIIQDCEKALVHCQHEADRMWLVCAASIPRWYSFARVVRSPSQISRRESLPVICAYRQVRNCLQTVTCLQ